MSPHEPDAPDPLAPLRALLTTGQQAAAREALGRLLADPTRPLDVTASASAFVMLARADERAGDLPRARDAYQRALTFADWPDVRLAHAALLLRLGERAGARRELERALERNPRYRAAALELALLDASEGRMAESLATLQALAAAPSEPGTMTAAPRFEEGLARLREEEVEQAAELLRRALAPGDDALERALEEAEASIATGDVGGGLARLRRCAADRPGYADVQAWLGVHEVRAGFVDDGVASLVRALEANPDYHAARLHLARALDLRGERERALVEVRAVLEAEPAHADASSLLDRLGGRRRTAA